MDWSKCQDVESLPDRLSGQWVVRDTRVPVQALLDNAEDGLAAHELAELYQGVGAERVRRILAFAREHATYPA